MKRNNPVRRIRRLRKIMQRKRLQKLQDRRRQAEKTWKRFRKDQNRLELLAESRVNRKNDRRMGKLARHLTDLSRKLYRIARETV